MRQSLPIFPSAVAGSIGATGSTGTVAASALAATAGEPAAVLVFDFDGLMEGAGKVLAGHYVFQDSLGHNLAFV